MALALKKYTLVPTAAGTLDPLFPDGSAAPSAPVLGAVTVVSAIRLDIALLTVSTGGVAPLTYILERSETSASAGFAVIHFNAFSPTSGVYEDTPLAEDTQYWYRVYAVDSNSTPRQSEYSSVVTGVTDIAASEDVTPPDQATPPVVSSVTTTTITLTWAAVADH